MKRILIFLLLAAALLSLAGCGSAEPVAMTELWVVTEQSNSDGMNLQAEIIGERLEEAYPGLTVTLDILPTDGDEREVRLTQLRTQIMAGNGPDVYLLPTGDELISDEPARDDNIPITPLFPDVQQAMRNGVFLNISEYYDSDAELNSAALKQEIMNAGCLDDRRYVLPMRYQIPVIYTQPDLCSEYGLPQELFESDFLTVAKTILSVEDAKTAAIGLKFPEELETLGALLDYESGEVLLTEQQIADYMRLRQSREAVATASAQSMYDECDYYRIQLYFSDGRQECTIENWDNGFGKVAWPKRGEFHHECFNLLSEYCYQLYHWSTSGMPLYTGYLSDVLETIGVTRITGQEVEIYPLRTLDGSVQASVTYWGAVGSSCADPAIAYAFLRQFLEEEFQWDIYRPRVNNDGPYWAQEHDPQFKRQVEDSFPVRTEGCIAYLWDNLQYQVEKSFTSWVKKTKTNVGIIQNEVVTAEDVPSLDWEISHVCFPISQGDEKSLEYAMSLLNKEDGTPIDVDINELAEEVWENLWWHLAEG